MQDLLEKEFERAVADAQGRRGPLVDVATVEEVILKLLLGDLVGGFVVEIHQHAYHAGIGLLGTFGSCQLQRLCRSFVPVGHHSRSPFDVW